MSPNRAYLLLALPAWALFSWITFYFQGSWYSCCADYWEYTATLNAWINDFWDPNNHRFPIEAGSIRNMPYFAIIVLLAKLFDLDAIEAMSVAGFIAGTFFLISTHLFANAYFRKEWASSVALIFFLCGWGAAWYWSNVYQLRDLIYIISYPSFFVFSFSLLLFWYTIRHLRSGAHSLHGILLISVMVAFALSSHPPTGIFAIITLLLLCVFEDGVSVSVRLSTSLSILVGILLTGFWPFYSYWDLLLMHIPSPSSESTIFSEDIFSAATGRAAHLVGTHPFYKTKEVLMSLGPSLLAAPVLIYFMAKRTQLFIVAGSVVMLTAYIINLFIPIPLGHRFLLFAIFFLQMALVWFVLMIFSSRYDASSHVRTKKFIALVAFAVMISWNIYLLAIDISRIRSTGLSLVNDLRPLTAYLDSQSIVMVPIRDGWPLPTFAGKTVGALRETYLYFGNNSRNTDTEHFFNLNTSNQDRMKIALKYGVTHIVLRKKRMQEVLITQLESLADSRTEVGNYLIFTIPKHKEKD